MKVKVDYTTLVRRVAEIAQNHIGPYRPGKNEPEDREYWDMCQRVIDGEQPAANAEPVAWGAFHFGGKRDGKLYSFCDTRKQIDTYIADVHRSNDSITLRAKPLYTEPQLDRVAELTAEVERLRGWLAMIIKLYEDASPCYDEPDGEGCFMGYVIHIDNEPFKAICDWLNAHEQDGKEAQS